MTKKMIEKVVINAGKVWSVLEKNSKQEIKDLKKTTKLTDKELYAALGWLGREEKIAIDVKNKEIFISLI